MVRVGLDFVERHWPRELKNARIGLLVHPASVNRSLEHAVDVCFSSRKFILKKLFGPQHGIRGETQDNMIEWEGFKDKKTGLSVFSLYGRTRKPDFEMLNDIDAMVVDLQDVGARYYTFIWTLALLMDACRQLNKAVIVLDRPNPIGGRLIEGPVLKPEYKSFVGLHELPVRHGMTLGELATYMKDTIYRGLNLHVIPMKGWTREMWFDDTGLPWIFPSPNMPTIETAMVYPGMCLLEGTNISEGRGTTKPFEIFGAPFIDPDKFIKQLADYNIQGAVLRPLYFQPTFHKYSEQVCGGLQIHVRNKEKYRPFRTAVAVIKAIHDCYPEHFAWRQPPYEYENELLPIDILAGTDRVRIDIEEGSDFKKMELWWNDELREFDKKHRRKYLYYR